MRYYPSALLRVIRVARQYGILFDLALPDEGLRAVQHSPDAFTLINGVRQRVQIVRLNEIEVLSPEQRKRLIDCLVALRLHVLDGDMSCEPAPAIRAHYSSLTDAEQIIALQQEREFAGPAEHRIITHYGF